MSTEAGSLKSNVEYHPYLALLVQFDHADALRVDQNSLKQGSNARDESSFAGNAKLFKGHCAALRNELVKEAEYYPCDYPPQPFSGYLYRPLCLAALGHADDLSLTLIDSFVAAARLTAVAEGAENSDMAFCPRLRSIALPSSTPFPEMWRERIGTKNADLWPFYEPDELFEPKCGAGAAEATAGAFGIPGAPLCVVTNLNTNVLAEMPHGLRMQEAVYATLLTTVRRILIGMLQTAPTSNSELYTAEDVLSAKYLLLEPQGAENVTLVCFCNNYTVANTVLAVIRALTIRDAWTCADAPLTESITRSELHEQIAALTGTPAQKEEDASKRLEAILRGIGGNHLFMRSYSTLCFAHEVLNGGRGSEVRGVCEAQLYFDVSPGHEDELSKCFNQAVEDAFRDFDPASLAGINASLESSTCGVLPGVHDLSAIVYPKTTMHAQERRLIPTDRFFSFLKSFFDVIDVRRSSRSLATLAMTETGFMDLTSSLMVRTPLIDDKNLPALAPFLPGGRLPRKVDWNTHRYGMDYFVEIRKDLEERLKLKNLLELRKVLRGIGCPPALQYSLLYMCQEFLDCLEDPLRCEAVLDLYDPIAMFVGYLAEDGPMVRYFSKIEPEWRRNSLQANFFTYGPFRDYIDALQEAFTLRIQRIIPHHEFRDTAFNLKAGAGKLIAAMDAPLKCSIGLFRTVACQAHEERNRIGSITTLNTRQDMSVSFGLWPENNGKQSGTASDPSDRFAYMSVKMDAFYLYRPEQVYYFLHEVAHMLFDERAQSNPGLKENVLKLSYDQPNASGKINAKSRTEEIFADLLAALFIFEDDVKLFGKFHGVAFSDLASRVIRADDKSTDESYQLSLLEVFLRGFLVAELIQTIHQPINAEAQEQLPTNHPYYRPDKQRNATDIYQRMLNYAREVGPCYRDLKPFWNKDPDDFAAKVQMRCRAIARDLATKETAAVLARLWTSAAEIWKQYWSTRPATGQADLSRLGSVDAEIRAVIIESYRSGRGLARTGWSSAASGEDRENGLDSLFVITRILREYVQFLLGDIHPEIALFTSEWTDGVEQKPGGQRFSRYLMLKTHLPMHAAHPQARQEKLLAQISFLKTLWDISTQLRSRRLVEMGRLTFAKSKRTTTAEKS